MNDIDQMISRLERQKEAIDRAIMALREIEGFSPTKESVSAPAGTQTGHRKKSVNLPASPGVAKEPLNREAQKRGYLTAAGRKKLSLAAKRRWALAKRKGLNAVTGKPLSKAA